MSNVVRAQAGGFVPIRLKTRERRSDAGNGRLFAVNGLRVTDILDGQGTTIGAPFPAFTYVRDGEYVTHWDARARAAGDYQFKVLVMVGYDTVLATGKEIAKHFYVRLLPQGAP